MNQPPRAQLKVNHPSLTLYAFHLRHSLAEGLEQVREDAAHLWEQCVQLGEDLQIDNLKSLKSKIEETGLENQYSDKHSLVTIELLGKPPKLEFSVPLKQTALMMAIYRVKFIHIAFTILTLLT